MAVPMWFVAAAMGLAGESLFPNQLDFRILMAEPLSRPTIFGAKLAALLLFGGLFVAGTHVALAPLAALTMLGMLRTGSFVITLASFAVSSALASLFAALAIVAVHGALVLFAPRARLVAFSGAVRSVTIGGLLLVSAARRPAPGRRPRVRERTPGGSDWYPRRGSSDWSAGSSAISVSLRLLLSPRSATVSVLAVSVGSYVLLYRRFDRVTLQPAVSRRADASDRSLARWSGRAPVRHAIGRFIAITIRRSPLHQGLVVGLLAAAGGFVLNSLLNASGWHDPTETRQKRALINTLLWAADDDGLPRCPGDAPGNVDTPRPASELGIPTDGGRGWPRGSGRGEPARGVGARGCSTAGAHRTAAMVDAGPASLRRAHRRDVSSAGCSSNGRWPAGSGYPSPVRIFPVRVSCLTCS